MPRIKMLDKVANEESTYPIAFYFRDKNNDLIEYANIKTLYWYLTLIDGTVVNGRSKEVGSVSANPWNLVLSGDDLQLFKPEEDSFGTRVVTLDGTYDSEYGNNLPFTYAVMFKIQNMIVIAKDLSVSIVDVVFSGESVNAS